MIIINSEDNADTGELAELREADLEGAMLSNTDLRGSMLIKSDLVAIIGGKGDDYRNEKK